MRYIEIAGHRYRSIREACQTLSISYQKVKRLCRHYQRAYVDPAVALEWCLGTEEFIPSKEKKTFKYKQDLDSGLLRQLAYKERCHEIIVENF